MASIEPIILSTKDIGVPIVKVEAIRAVDITDGGAGTSAVNPQVAWEKGSDINGPFIKITDLVGLDPSRKYRIQFLLSA